MNLYIIENLNNGRRYIGITRGSIARRFSRHCLLSENPKCLITKAIRAHGRENFRLTLLARAETWKELQAMERRAIKKYRTFVKEGGYNLTHGGEGILGLKMSKEAIERGRQKRLGFKHTPEARAKISEAQRGTTHSEATKAKMRATAKSQKRKLTPEQIAKRQATRLKNTGGQYFTKEALARGTLGSPPGHKHTDEAKAKIGKANRGRQHTDADKLKMRRPVRVRGVDYTGYTIARKALGLSTWGMGKLLASGEAQYT